jgi:hypothetical protein
VARYRSALAAGDGITEGHRDQASALRGLGDALAQLGLLDEARQAWQSALPIFDRLRDAGAAQLRAQLGSPS